VLEATLPERRTGLQLKAAAFNMAKTNNYQKSRIPPEGAYTPGEFTGHEEAEIDLERGRAANQQAEQSNPVFKALMDKLREAARKVGRTMIMLFL
jgi:hypothetical protein